MNGARGRLDLRQLVRQHVEIDMTPMIDCVFLLMIFFVLVIDLSQKNLEDLILPRAESIQQLDEKPPDNRPIINVLQDGSVVYNQVVRYSPSVNGKDYGPIRDMLLAIREAGLASKKLQLVDEVIGGRTVKVLDAPILIRADKWTEWTYVGEIMKQCSRPEIAFSKVELAMSEKDKELDKAPVRRKS